MNISYKEYLAEQLNDKNINYADYIAECKVV